MILFCNNKELLSGAESRSGIATLRSFDWMPERRSIILGSDDLITQWQSPGVEITTSGPGNVLVKPPIA